MGDASGDGKVGSADLDIVRAHWGEGRAPVPEPGIWVFLTLAASFAAVRRYRR